MGSNAMGVPSDIPTPSMYGGSPGGQQAGFGTGQDLFGQAANYTTPGAYGAFAPQQAGYGGSQVLSTQALEPVAEVVFLLQPVAAACCLVHSKLSVLLLLPTESDSAFFIALQVCTGPAQL